MEKASFDRLNKLFVIYTSERNYQTLMTDQNLLAVVQEPQSYVLPILSRSTSKVLGPSEHHVLKDLSFYKIAHAAYPNVPQNWLNQREKKRQERTLMQAPGASRSAIISIACPPSKKKKPVAQPTRKVQALPLKSPPTSAYASSSAVSSEQDSVADSSSTGTELETEVEPVVPRIICEVEEEEDMAVNIRGSFKERQRKRLSESIAVASPPTKRSCMEVPRATPVQDIPPVPKPPTNVARPSCVPAVRPPIGKYARLE